MAERYIGLLSGTSIDAIDAVLVEFTERVAAPLRLRTLATNAHPISPPLRDAILSLCASGGSCELDRAGKLDRQLGRAFAEAALTLLERAATDATTVSAIGCHGQTVRHRPPGTTDIPFSVQLGDPNTIATLTGITTVADFRRRDIALGGHGAPLMPAFHRAVFSTENNRAIVNIGGIANITTLAADGGVRGYDTGPGNVLLDYWAQQHKGLRCDTDGHWAASGQVHPLLFKRMLDDPFFAMAPPKSTGREAFNPAWLKRACAGLNPSPSAVQATLAEVTAATIATAVTAFAPSGELLICGGGARNKDLLRRLQLRLPAWSVHPTDRYGIDADWVEGLGFAWLARQTLHGLPGNCPAVTGARKEAVLGAVYSP